jgi:thymidine phosphorylase
MVNASGANVQPGDHVVLKIDVEGMEFAILHQMARSGVLGLVSELLVECHYNTNAPRSERDATKDIGKDNCFQMVRTFQASFGGNMEVVLWNDNSTVAATNRHYTSKKGGFYPT